MCSIVFYFKDLLISVQDSFRDSVNVPANTAQYIKPS